MNIIIHNGMKDIINEEVEEEVELEVEKELVGVEEVEVQ